MAQSAKANTVTGYITAVDSPDTFDIGSMSALITAQTTCTDLVLSLNGQESHVTSIAPCTTRQTIIGTHVMLIGQFTKARQFIVSHLEMREGYREPCQWCPLMTFHKTAFTVNPGALVHTALAEEAPTLTASNQGWDGTWWIDGYPISVTSQTKLILGPDSGGLRQLGVNIVNCAPLHSTHPNNDSHEIRSSKLLSSNTVVFYCATDLIDATPIASRMFLWPDKTEVGEKDFSAMYAAKIEQPDYGASIPGNLQYSSGGKIQIVPDKSVQEYISKLGTTLVPSYQKDMTALNPEKVNFHFYVVRPFVYARSTHFVSVDGCIPNNSYKNLSGERYNAPTPNTLVESIIALPDGTILVPDTALAHMQREAQVAALLSYGITSIVQKQAYHAWPIVRPHRIGDETDSFLSYALRASDEQLLRIGIRQMYLAGYDIREAPYAWAVAKGKPVNNPVIDSKHPDKEIPWYAAYAFDYISHYYADVDYSKLKRGEQEYAQFLEELRKADPQAFEPSK